MAYCALVDMRSDTVMHVVNSLPGLFASLFGTAGFPVPGAGKPAGRPDNPLYKLKKSDTVRRRKKNIPCSREFLPLAARHARRYQILFFLQ
jgi:hypothetical protein